MPYFPVFMNLDGVKVLVVGGGTVAQRKVEALLKCNARVTVVAPSIADDLKKRHLDGDVCWIRGRFAPDQLNDAWLVFAATDDRGLNQQIYREGQARRIPVNVVDDGELCRFISPAIIDRSPVQVAVTTGGTSPMLARAIRSWIEKLLPIGLGKIAVVAGQLRSQFRGGRTAEQRRRSWKFLFDRSRAIAWSAGAPGEISRQMTRELDASAGGRKHGKVFLVGAGPGNPDLLTVRALEVLQDADVILHDRLVPGKILDLGRRDAERIDVGKRVGAQKGIQSKIFELMIQLARSGKTVVRLKGGDAFVFGRGGEEIQHLKAFGVEYEVVPGITAALGCAAYAGIPLTHRDHAQRLVLATGHLADGNNIRKVAYKDSPVPVLTRSVGKNETLAVYMGVRQSAKLSEQLVELGMEPGTPAALIINGTMETQRVLHGTVSTLPLLAANVGHNEAGLFIIGEVAALGRELAWFGERLVFEEAA